MANQLMTDQEKIDEYFSVIQERILIPIIETGIDEYCTATLLILFAAIDGLGKLLHRNVNAGPNTRILEFLVYMGGDYKLRKKELLNLRNSLVHNALNVDTFLSYVEEGGSQHLKKLGADGFIYVNTSVMYKDFVKAFDKFSDEIQHDQVKRTRAANRLEMLVVNPSNYLNNPDQATPSFPPPVKFIYVKPKLTFFKRIKKRLKMYFPS